MVDMSIKEMLEAGAHFGHQTRHWHPAMKPYIYGAKNGIHIIDLQKTLPLCREACRFVTQLVSEGGTLLFVGTKKQAQAIVEEEAKRSQMFYVSRRWLGGTLTNFQTIKASLDRLRELEKSRSEGGFDVLTKKERLMKERKIEKLMRLLGGIKEMTHPPAAVFVIDVQREEIARKEANRIGIPVVALADTNCNPVGVDCLMPANDDAIKSIRYFCKMVADACLEGLTLRETVMREKLLQEGAEKELAILEREQMVRGKGRAFVSGAEVYEKEVNGEYTGKKAEEEKKEVV